VNGRRSLSEVRRKVELHLLSYFGERRRMTSITTADMRAFIAERQREEKADDGTVTKRAASNAEICARFIRVSLSKRHDRCSVVIRRLGVADSARLYTWNLSG
jgi:hypothetical protein